MQVPVAQLAHDLEAQILNQGSEEVSLTVSDVSRPGLQLAGWLEYFAPERVMVIGAAEAAYLEHLGEQVRRQRLRELFAYDIPCVIVARGLELPDLVAIAKETGRTVLQAPQTTTVFLGRLVAYLDDILSPRMMQHGVLVDVFGAGILLLGSAGVGKSETALELLQRGHRLVADDIVQLQRRDSIIVGKSPSLSRHLMEIRGVGLINIVQMYGVGSVLDRCNIDAAMTLEPWQSGQTYEHIGHETGKYDIMGVDIPHLLLPVAPGRNLAMVIEVAVRHLRLRERNAHGAIDLENRLRERREKKEKSGC